MKSIFTGAVAQTKTVDSLSFCFHKYKAPADCPAESEYQLHCTDYSIAWLYMNGQMLATLPEQFMEQLGRQAKDFQKEPISCYLLGQQVNGQPVLVQLGLNKEPKVNEDIPAFPRKIITLTQ